MVGSRRPNPGLAVNAKNTKRPKKFSTAGGAVRHAQSLEKIRRAREQIKDFYQPGWPGFTEPQKASRSAIARTLARRTIVTSFKDELRILKILEDLEKEGKIKLPPKTGLGGARVKGVKKKKN